MLNTGFDAVFFGHTHKGYIGQPSVKILGGLLNDKRKGHRFWTCLIPKWLLRKTEEDCLVSYKREAARNGQFPTLKQYFDYLYLVQQGHDLQGPPMFDNIKQFYLQMAGAAADQGMAAALVEAKKKKVLISLAPSACQPEARWKGFHTVNLSKINGVLSASWDRYEFDGANFSVMGRNTHVS